MPVRVWGPGSDQFAGANDSMPNAEYANHAVHAQNSRPNAHPQPKNSNYRAPPPQHHRQFEGYDGYDRGQVQHQQMQQHQMQQRQMQQHQQHMGPNVYESTGLWEPGAGWIPPPPQNNYQRIAKAPAPRSFQREKPIGDGQLKPLKLKARVDEADVELPEMSSADGTRYVIIEMKGCDRGPPLIPVNNKWCAPEDCSMPLRAYLVALADRNGGAITAVDKIDGRCLPRYQCAVRAEKWQDTWNIVRKSFLEMRSAYRFIRGGKNAPNLWFGMPARFLEPGLGSNGNSNSNSNSVTPSVQAQSQEGDHDRASLWQLTQERLAEQEAALQTDRGMNMRGGYPGNYHTLLLHTPDDKSTWAPWTNSTAASSSGRTTSTRV